ncbi:hypothetical protein KCU62_g266, partial [Aureobasidium sp. EXF-3399]
MSPVPVRPVTNRITAAAVASSLLPPLFFLSVESLKGLEISKRTAAVPLFSPLPYPGAFFPTEPPTYGWADSAPFGQLGIFGMPISSPSGFVKADMMPFKESGISKGSDCAGISQRLDGLPVRSEHVAQLMRVVERDIAARVFLFFVLPELELSIKLFAQLPDVLLFSLLFDTLLYALDRIVNGTDASHTLSARNFARSLPHRQKPLTGALASGYGDFLAESDTKPETSTWLAGNVKTGRNPMAQRAKGCRTQIDDIKSIERLALRVCSREETMSSSEHGERSRRVGTGEESEERSWANMDAKQQSIKIQATTGDAIVPENRVNCV